jgi:predicted nucleic acid-binding Zn ribbon protein
MNFSDSFFVLIILLIFVLILVGIVLSFVV